MQDTARRDSMTAIVCDICKKGIPGARKDVNYVTVLDRDLCIDCHDEVQDVAKMELRTRRPYIFRDYQDTLTKQLLRMTG
jgi:hypothetical protein